MFYNKDLAMIKATVIAISSSLLGACATIPPPSWLETTPSREAEYQPYTQPGTGVLTGQAFLTQRGGVVVIGAGMEVTLDPATSTGDEWWGKAGKSWVFRHLTPPSPKFHSARKTTIADGDGRFKFTDLPAGRYYVRTEVTWYAVGEIQGGLVGSPITIQDGKPAEVILNRFTP